MISHHLSKSWNPKLLAIRLYPTKHFAKNFSISSFFKRKPEPVPIKYELVKVDDIASTVNFFKDNFFQDEPLCKSLCLGKIKGKDEVLLDDTMKNSLKQGMSILARKADENEIIGACINTRNCPWDAQKIEECAKTAENANLKKLLYIWALMSREPKLHEELGVNSLFEISLCATNKNHCNAGIGTELVRRSMHLGRDLSFDYGVLACTSNYTMKISEKFKTKKIWDVSYRNILMCDGKTPLAVPEYPHTHAAVYYINLKRNLD